MPLVITLSVIGVLTAIFTFAMVYAYKRAFKPVNRKKYDIYRGYEDGGKIKEAALCREMIAKMTELKTETVSIKSADGLTLTGYYLHLTDGAPVHILFHGFRSSWHRDFFGITPVIIGMGHNVLFVDQRSHGRSEGRALTYGIKERLDAVCWAKYVKERFGDVPIILFGVSMGAATVLCASGEELPKNVKGVFADCPFSSTRDIIATVSRGKKPFVAVALGLALTCARLFCGFNPWETSPKEAVKRAKVPILMVHGKKDALVPYRMSEEIAKSNPSIRVEFFDDAIHAQSFMSDRERYSALYKTFVKQITEKV